MNEIQKEWERILPGLKIVPGDKLPKDVKWHVCGTQPMPGASNQQGRCSRCLATVYFSDERPGLKKICVNCILEYSKTNQVKTVGTTDSLRRAMLARHRN